MLTFIREKQTVWERLQAAAKPLYLYGMGNGADKILDRFAVLGIKVAGVFASDAFVRGQSFRGYTVHTYAETVRECADFIVVLAFASQEEAMLDYFRQLELRHEVYAPHVPLFDGEPVVNPAWLKEHEDVLSEVYVGLADERSREVFADILDYKLSGKLSYLWHSQSERYSDLTTIFTISSQESFVDLGAYDGDTIREFLALTNGHYQSIFAFEPDGKNFKKLRHFIEIEQLRHVRLLNKGAWSEDGELHFCQRGGRMSALDGGGETVVPVTSADVILGENPVTYMKLDVEGAEYEALVGAREHIVRDHPKLLLAGYHHDDDLWRLPLLLRSMGEYEIFLRRHPYVPAWEINFLCR